MITEPYLMNKLCSNVAVSTRNFDYDSQGGWGVRDGGTISCLKNSSVMQGHTSTAHCYAASGTGRVIKLERAQ